MNPEQKRIAIELMIEKSNRNLEQAKANADLGYWDLVSNRLYYSIFHCVNALLLCDGIKTNTHKGTSAQFGLHYVLTGNFPKEDGTFYSKLQTLRERADYQNIFSLSPEEGMPLLEKTCELQIKLIKFILSKLSEING